jgi:hypothetical protein
MNLPSINILAAGAGATIYAALAAECLWHYCPENMRSALKIQISCTAMPPEQMTQARKFLKQFNGVSVLEDPIWIPSQKIRSRYGRQGNLITSTYLALRNLALTLGVSPRKIIKLIPACKGKLADYYHEWIVGLCDLFYDQETLFILDGDFFVSDPEFFNIFRKPLPDNVFANGWISRCDDKLYRYPADTDPLVPMGSECFKMSIPTFNRLNRQCDLFIKRTQKDLKKRFPGISFERPNTDTIYQASWEAQLEGYKLTYDFSDIKHCHVGGFSHANKDYIIDAMNTGDKNLTHFWIQRMRLNQRVSTFLEARYLETPLVTAVQEIHKRASGAWEIPSIKAAERDVPQSNDEIAFEQICFSLAGGQETDVWR